MNRRGFSLLEVLVSCSILLIFFILLAQSLQMSGNIWTGGRSRSETRRVLRAAQDSIRSDLQAVALPVDEAIVPNRGNLQMVINPPSVPEDYQSPDVFFWQAPIATDTSEGTYAELGYFIRWRNHRASLCRLFLNPSESRTLIGTSDTLQRVYEHPGDWVNQTVLETAAPADRANGYLGLFAENVIGFWVRPLNSQGNVEYNAGPDGFDSNNAFSGKAAPTLPAAVEISFVVIDSVSANRLAERNDAATLISQMRNIAREARTASDQSPAANFVARLGEEADLLFLHKGASPHQMLVNFR